MKIENPDGKQVIPQPNKYKAVTPHNDNNLDVPMGVANLFIGTGGNINIMGVDGNTEIFQNIPDGTFLPIEVKRVLASDTSAENIIALYS